MSLKKKFHFFHFFQNEKKDPLTFFTHRIGVGVMKEVKISEGKMVSTSDNKPIQTEVSFYDVDISLYSGN